MALTCIPALGMAYMRGIHESVCALFPRSQTARTGLAHHVPLGAVEGLAEGGRLVAAVVAVAGAVAEGLGSQAPVAAGARRLRAPTGEKQPNIEYSLNIILISM